MQRSREVLGPNLNWRVTPLDRSPRMSRMLREKAMEEGVLVGEKVFIRIAKNDDEVKLKLYEWSGRNWEEGFEIKVETGVSYQIASLEDSSFRTFFTQKQDKGRIERGALPRYFVGRKGQRVMRLSEI